MLPAQIFGQILFIFDVKDIKSKNLGGSDTRGSETSQYPKEKKIISYVLRETISLVAASERERAQTCPSLFAPQRASEQQVCKVACHSVAPNEVRSGGWGL